MSMIVNWADFWIDDFGTADYWAAEFYTAEFWTAEDVKSMIVN